LQTPRNDTRARVERRRVPGSVLLCALMLCVSRDAHAQKTGPALTDNNFNLDIVTGPVLGSGRIIGLGGAYTALANGIEGAPWNAASYANRSPWDTGWFKWDATASIVPTMLRNSDFENNGQSGFTYGDFVFGTVGLGLRFGEIGIGGLLNLHSYKLGDTADLSLAIANYGAGYLLADGQLVVGAGVRTAILTISDNKSGDTLVDVGGTGPEVGALLQLADQPFRVGFAARMPVDSGGIHELRAAGKWLPREIRLPWEVQAGASVQLGPRPLNRKWINPHDVEKQLRDEMLARRRARAREQVATEILAQDMQMAEDRAPPSVAALEPHAHVAEARDGVPHDRAFWAAEWTQRSEEERELSARVAELSQERDREVRALSRRYLLLSAETIIVGETPNAVGLESFLSQQRQVSGKNATVGARLGVEGEPIANWVQMRVGTYFEPSRFEGVGYRVHATLGTDVRLFSWDLFGLLDEFTLTVGAAADVAERYLNAGLGVGLWH
jgi:hypothetical protein